MGSLRILLISGSTRTGSSNTLALRTLADLDEPGVQAEIYDGLADLPAFVPDHATPASVDELLKRIEEAAAVVFSTPEYAGGLPGSLKNLLDWTVGGGQLYRKPVAWLDVAHPGRGHGARAQLSTVLGYVGAHVVDDACVHLDMERSTDTATLAPGSEHKLRNVLAALVSAVREANA